jgi:hypothetical protein
LGIQYYNSPNELKGCKGDLVQTACYLRDNHGYQQFTFGLERASDLPPDLAPLARRVFVPPGDAIRSAFKEFAADCNRVAARWGGCQAWLSYSGHGGSVQASAANAAEETDGRSETWIPTDHATAGQILDVEVNNILCKPLDSRVNLTVLSDCCHSGTNLQCLWVWDAAVDKCRRESSGTGVTANIMEITGCMDSQTSADVTANGRSQGAATAAFLSVLAKLKQRGRTATVGEFADALHASMASGGYTQRPQIASSRPLTANTPMLLQPSHAANKSVRRDIDIDSNMEHLDYPVGAHWLLC